MLSTYDYARGPEGATGTLMGSPLASAAGPLQQLSLGLNEGDEDGERLTKAHIWEGGRSKIDNTWSLLMNGDQQFSRRVNQMADRINQVSTSARPPTSNWPPPNARPACGCECRRATSLNVPHFIRVVRLIPMEDVTEQSQASGPGQPKSYRQRLTEDLLDPSRTVIASLRLEALGQKSVPTLKQGLASPQPLVRFCAAEGLTTSATGAGRDERWPTSWNAVNRSCASYARSALASLDEENVTRMRSYKI